MIGLTINLFKKTYDAIVEKYFRNDALFYFIRGNRRIRKHYKIVFGIILGSGVGEVWIDKKIVSGPHGITGEWGHNQLH